MSRIISPVLTPVVTKTVSDPLGITGTSWTPLDLFKSGDTGFLFDSSYKANFWQDAARTTPVTASGDLVGSAEDAVFGNFATQTTDANRPTWTNESFNTDGVSTHLKTSFTPTNEGTVIVVGTLMALGAQLLSSYITGSFPTTACSLAARGDGALQGIVGNSGQFYAGASLLNIYGVNILSYDATSATIFRNTSQIASASRSGTLSGAIPLYIGCTNDNGTASAFADFNYRAAIYITRAITPAERQLIVDYYGA
jgi:hypothetical protein